MTEQGLFTKSLAGARWMGISKAITTAFTWSTTFLVMRLLSPKDYGLVAMGGLLTALVGMLLDAGLGAAFIQRKHVTDAEYRSANFLLLLSSIVAVAIVQIAARPMATFFATPTLELVLRVSSLQFVVAAANAIPQAMLVKAMRFREVALIQTAAGVGSGVTTLLLAAGGAGVWALVFGTMSIGVLRFAGFTAVMRGVTGYSRNLRILASYWSFSAHLLAQRLTWFWVEQMDLFIIGKRLGALPLGAYSTARDLSHAPLDRSGEIINQISLPAFAAMQGETERCRAALGKLLRLAAALAFPTFWGMGAIANVALPVVLGAKWNAATQPFMLFCAILPLRMSHSILCIVILALGRADLSFRSIVIFALVMSPLFLLSSQFGINGIAASWVAGFPIVYGLSVWMICRAMGMRASTMVLPLVWPALAAALCVAVAIAMRGALGGAVPAVVLMMLQVLFGALTYFVALRVLNRTTFEELLEAAQGVVGRRSAFRQSQG